MTSPASPPLPTTPGVALPRIPMSTLAPYLAFASVMVAVLYLLFVDQGATSLVPGHWLHEFAHDGRHLFGFPCH